MASYSVAEAKNRLPALLVAAERGEAVTITRRGKPIAELRGVGAAPPVRGSTAWLRAELDAMDIPPSPIDSGTVVRAMRDEVDGW